MPPAKPLVWGADLQPSPDSRAAPAGLRPPTWGVDEFGEPIPVPPLPASPTQSDVANNADGRGAVSMRFSSPGRTSPPLSRLQQGIRNQKGVAKRGGAEDAANTTVFTDAIDMRNTNKKLWMRKLAARAVEHARLDDELAGGRSPAAGTRRGSPGAGDSYSDGGTDDDDDEFGDLSPDSRRMARRVRRAHRKVEAMVGRLTPLQQMAAERIIMGTPFESALARKRQFKLPKELMRLLEPASEVLRPQPPPPTEELSTAAREAAAHEIEAEKRREALWAEHA
eukprot:SAG22_NODE_3191_length_1865_cov_1.745753_1_plen_280_part_10